MVHRGIEYEIAKIEPGLWKYRIGTVIRTGKTKCSLELLAELRVRQKIDRFLRPSRPVTKRAGHRRMASTLDVEG